VDRSAPHPQPLSPSFLRGEGSGCRVGDFVVGLFAQILFGDENLSLAPLSPEERRGEGPGVRGFLGGLSRGET
jgi:hypothetical protein